LEILKKVETEGAYADIALDRALRESGSLVPIHRAFITELVYGTLRWQGRIDWIINQFSRIPTKKLDSSILSIVRMGVYQLLFLNKVPSFAAVNESVRLAKLYGHRGKVGFVNANLRAIERARDKIEYPDVEKDPILYVSVVYSHPLWMVKKWFEDFGVDATIDLCKGNNNVPPLTIRTNTLKVSRQELFDELKENVKGISLTRYCPEGIKVRGGSEITTHSSFGRGWFQVQDEASQLIAHLLTPLQGQRILDACAAPGGKTTHLAQLMEDSGEIYALDINEYRLTLLEESCNRLGVRNVKIFRRDASLPLGFSEMFHRILVDPPCSGLGVIRRNPDSRWKKKEEDIDPLKRLQLRILDNLAHSLKRGGVLVYSTCTITPEENEGVIKSFLENHKEFALERASEVLPACCGTLVDDRGFLYTNPGENDMDGFFAARLRKFE